MGQAFGVVMTGIGVIANAGVIVNNNIVLIDTYDRLRREGVRRLRGDPGDLPRARAAGGADRGDRHARRARHRLRHQHRLRRAHGAIGAPSTQWWIHLSTAIVFGLGFATILTLIVTPAALMALANLAAWRERRRERARCARRAQPEGAAVAGCAAGGRRRRSRAAGSRIRAAGCGVRSARPRLSAAHADGVTAATRRRSIPRASPSRAAPRRNHLVVGGDQVQLGLLSTPARRRSSEPVAPGHGKHAMNATSRRRHRRRTRRELGPVRRSPSCGGSRRHGAPGGGLLISDDTDSPCPERRRR